MNCVKCGNPLAEGNKFCMICGTAVKMTAPSMAQQVQSAPGPAQGDTVQAPRGAPQNASRLNPRDYTFVPPVMQGNNCIIQVGRTFRIYCPDCGHVSNAIKKDSTPGYPCPVCNKAYSYGGQILLYRMGGFDPNVMAASYNFILDGREIGPVINHSSVRIMVSSGTHIICCGNLRHKIVSNQFRINVTPESNSFGFKFKVVYRHFTLRGWLDFPIELMPCAPQEIPYI